MCRASITDRLGFEWNPAPAAELRSDPSAAVAPLSAPAMGSNCRGGRWAFPAFTPAQFSLRRRWPSRRLGLIVLALAAGLPVVLFATAIVVFLFDDPGGSARAVHRRGGAHGERRCGSRPDRSGRRAQGGERRRRLALPAGALGLDRRRCSRRNGLARARTERYRPAAGQAGLEFGNEPVGDSASYTVVSDQSEGSGADHSPCRRTARRAARLRGA